jgi:monoamine oxidase
MKEPQVIILGAGAAGLAAAQVLSKNGKSALLLEARDRIGGRVCTIRDPAFGSPVEMGAEFIHGRPEVTWDLLRKANLVAFDLPFDHRQRRNGHLTHLDDFASELGKVMAGLAHIGRRDISFAQYLRDQHSSTVSNNARRFAINFVQGFDAADPERISAKSVAEEQQGIGDVGEETQFRLRDGYGSLIDFMHGSLTPNRVQIRLNTIVTEIRWERSKVEIHASNGKETLTFKAPRVLITLPIGILQMPPEKAGSVRFTPDVPETRNAAMQLGSGPIVKAVMKFRDAFWETRSAARAARSDPGLRDAVFLHHPDAAFPTWWTARPLRLPMLTAWAGGPKALALAGLSKQELQRVALDSLGDLFGQRPTRLKSLLERFHVRDWASDPFARGAYSYVTVGGTQARKRMAKPIDNTLFFAGEATDISGQASTVAGALSSGQRAAKMLLDSF